MGSIDGIFRKLPLFRGKDRLAKMLLGAGITEKKNFLIRGKYGCAYMIPNVVENIGFELFINGIYEQATSDFITQQLPRNGVFLDLGANIGAISIPVYEKRKDLTMVCVEAAPWIFSYLEKNLALNQAGKIITVNKALYYTDEETLNFFSPDDKFGKGSLSPVFTDKRVEVKTVKVDSLLKQLKIDRVDMIKIDVEGYEYHAFKGATGLLGRPDAPDIIFEFVDWAEEAANGTPVGAAQELLKELGYSIYYFGKTGKMQEVPGILKKGFEMLLATKKKNS